MFIVFYVYKQSMKPGEKQQTNHLQDFFSPSNTPTHSTSPGPAARRVRQSLPWVWAFLKCGNCHGRKRDSFSYWWPALGTSPAGCPKPQSSPSTGSRFSLHPSVSISEQFIQSLVFGSSIRLMCLKMLFLMPRCWYFFVISFSLTLPEKGIPPVVFIV